MVELLSTVVVSGAAHLEREHGDFVRHVNVVPDTQIASVLSYDHIAEWNPLDVGTVAKQRATLLRLKVIEVKLRGRGVVE